MALFKEEKERTIDTDVPARMDRLPWSSWHTRIIAAYLTVSEIFPLEIRALAIAVFYALGTLAGGVGAPILFGVLIASGSKSHVAMGYALGSLLMLFAAGCEWTIGVEAAGKSLESVSKPLQSKG